MSLCSHIQSLVLSMLEGDEASPSDRDLIRRHLEHCQKCRDAELHYQCLLKAFKKADPRSMTLGILYMFEELWFSPEGEAILRKAAVGEGLNDAECEWLKEV